MDFPLICAVATPEGVGGISIIRLSGKGSWEMAQKVFRPHSPFDWETAKGFGLHYGHIVYNEKVYDEVLLALMKEERSYTKEDMAEIQCHGGFLSAKRILELLISLGVQLAQPGEFTKRAFFNGRIDLSQAEAVIETIHAMDDKDLDFSLTRLKGDKGRSFLKIRDDLVALIAETEAVIDFPEDGLDDTVAETIHRRVLAMVEAIDKEIAKADEGKVYRQGIATALAGRTNVGKSSLMNALLREERAIVTEIPGTTRDVIEDTVILKGIPLRLMDTAGIRETDDPVEKIGVDKSRASLKKSDLILFVTDHNGGFDEEEKDILKNCEHKKVIVVCNKEDIVDYDRQAMENAAKPHPVVFLSAKENSNLDALGEAVRNLFVTGAIAQDNSEWVGNLRHKESFIRAKHHLLEVLNAQEMMMPLDFQVIDLRGALEALGEINGESISMEVLDRIFSEFCIGK
ncbi:MAG: tRNA uridine-5-carboxymethylaminomethyl(34) synthesis GTPase MnmE [Firmicutes bacterium]|nr:tRNA uridine-5-carboxymethylaminomethyl(34) synthesis GTPase MnmE [Bacillota bacterium]